MMLIGLALFAIGWMLLCMDISSMETAIIGRLKTGVACGVMSIACPTYIGEVTTADVRGFFGAGFQFMGDLKIMRMKKVVFFLSYCRDFNGLFGWKMARLAACGSLLAQFHCTWRTSCFFYGPKLS